MDPHSLKVLEFEAALAIVARQATCSLGRDEVLALRPRTSREAVEAAQAEVREAIAATDEGVALAFGGLVDVRTEVAAAEKGVMLDARTLLAVGAALGAARTTRRALTGRAEKAPVLAERAQRLVDLAPLERRLSRTIGPDGDILDTASPTLERVRRQIRDLSGRMQNKMHSYLRDPNWSKMLQEPLITTRDERYVVPIKAEYRGIFPGLVLDSSASGATLFMEPLAVVELGNSLRQTQLEEKHEIDTLLRELSGLVGKHAADVGDSLTEIGHLDAVFAAARYAGEMDAELAPVNDRGFIRLVGARHPLLHGHVVPIDLEIGGSFHTLIITGPNTGGKTVTLKTLGLMTLMAMCGLPIPVSPGSEVSVMDGVFADIGDEQAIVQNLSTFSSHVSQIVRFLPNAGARTLVLMDELGTGTDPREGTGLAIAILEYLHNRQARTVITTHYSELKSFGATYPHAMNASVEFDEETLKPTYRVLIGLPGRSCALVISERLGVPEEVLRRARQLMGEAHFEVEELVEELEQQRTEAEKQSEALQQKLLRVQQLQQQYEEGLRDLRVRESSVLEQAVREAEDVVESAREELKAALRDTRQRLAAVRGDGQKSVDAEAIEVAEKGVRSSIEQVMHRLQATRELAGVKQAAPRRDYQVGDRVRIPRLSTTGVVAGPARGGAVQVQVGSVRMSLSPGELEYVGKGAPPQPRTVSVEGPRSPVHTASLRLDLRGMRADEAVYEVERFLDQASRTHAPSLAIIHGKGQGILRQSVQRYLKESPAVESYRLGDAHEGGAGVTVVMLK